MAGVAAAAAGRAPIAGIPSADIPSDSIPSDSIRTARSRIDNIRRSSRIDSLPSGRANGIRRAIAIRRPLPRSRQPAPDPSGAPRCGRRDGCLHLPAFLFRPTRLKA